MVDRDKDASSDFLIWITKTTTSGDPNIRRGIAEHIGGVIDEVNIPEYYCTLEDAKSNLISEGLIGRNNTQWPDVLIGPSFHIPYMQLIKTLSKNKTVIVALRPPVREGIISACPRDIERTDLIISYPYHNNKDLPNLMIVRSVANRVSGKTLASACIKDIDGFSNVFREPCSTIGVIVGGNIGDNRCVFTPELAVEFASMVDKVAEEMGANIALTFSVRTPDLVREAILGTIKCSTSYYDPKSPTCDNPYYNILACSDFLITTADSISMCCEASSSGKPLYIFYDDSIVENTHSIVVSYLLMRGSARIFSGEVLEEYEYPPANSAIPISDKIIDIVRDKSVTRTPSIYDYADA